MEIEGIMCNDKSVYETKISKGDLYLAKRNTGWHLLTCKKFDERNNIVFAQELAYCFDSWECFLVLK